MLEKQILEILTEKRVVDKENMELEFKRQGKGETEADQKHKQLEAELEQAMRLRRQNEVMKESAEHMSTLLADEEKRAKDLLDQKITVDQTMELKTEDAEKMAAHRRNQRQELIDKKLRLSMLESANRQLTEEDKVLAKSNAELLKENDEIEKKNEELTKEINLLIQRIDVSTLLKQIDLEEMRMLANNNTQMSMAFQGVLNQWEQILKNEKNETK